MSFVWMVFGFPNDKWTDWFIIYYGKGRLFASLTFKGKRWSSIKFFVLELTFEYDCQSRYSNADWFALILFLVCKCNCLSVRSWWWCRTFKALTTTISLKKKLRNRSILISHCTVPLFQKREQGEEEEWLIFNLFVCILFLHFQSFSLLASLEFDFFDRWDCWRRSPVLFQESLCFGSHKVCSRRRIKTLMDLNRCAGLVPFVRVHTHTYTRPYILAYTHVNDSQTGIRTIRTS